MYVMNISDSHFIKNFTFLGTGYSGDDEGSARCDICSNRVEGGEKIDGSQRRKRSRRSRKNRSKKRWKKSKEIKDAILIRELPRTDNFEFEGEKKAEMKWTLECFLDTNLIPQLKSVVIDRGRQEDLGTDNLMVFDESSVYCRIQSWRQDVVDKLCSRNHKQVKEFSLLPTYLSCDSCTDSRHKEIQLAIDQGGSWKFSGDPSSYPYGKAAKISNAENTTGAAWKKKIMYGLKLNNCRAQACIRAVKRDTLLTTSYRFGKIRKRRNGMLTRVEEEDWEVYEIISDEEFLDAKVTL